MEMLFVSTQAVVLYAFIALAIVGYVTSKNGLNRVGYDCNKRKEDEEHN